MPVCAHTGTGAHYMGAVTAGFTACTSVKQLKIYTHKTEEREVTVCV